MELPLQVVVIHVNYAKEKYCKELMGVCNGATTTSSCYPRKLCKRKIL
jgi:hypothetical protein